MESGLDLDPINDEEDFFLIWYFFLWEAFWEKISYEIFKFWARISKGVDIQRVKSIILKEILLENKDDTYPGYDGGTLYFICIHTE